MNNCQDICDRNKPDLDMCQKVYSKLPKEKIIENLYRYREQLNIHIEMVRMLAEENKKLEEENKRLKNKIKKE